MIDMIWRTCTSQATLKKVSKLLSHRLSIGTPAQYYSKMRGLILGVYTESSDNGYKISSHTPAFKDIDKKYNGKLTEIVNKSGPFFKPAKLKLLWLPEIASNADSKFDCVSVVDLGSQDVEDSPLEGTDQKSENVRGAIANGVRALQAASNFEDIYLDPCNNPHCAAEGALLSTHVYDQLKKKSSKPKSQFHLYKYEGLPENFLKEYERGVAFSQCNNFARLLMETPANYMTPTIFASSVEEKLKKSGIEVIVREKEWIESMKMGSFLSVAQGSEQPPKFVELHYKGSPDTEDHIAFVGKGITFDTGGISLKQSTDMDAMRADMGGAACVAAAILGAGMLKLKLNIKGYIPLTENMPSGKATKPGDVVFAMNGKSIQVNNTDAEGRLVLADGLCYAQTFKPKAIIDIATLTGAMCIAIGEGASGVFSNDDNLFKTLDKAAYITGDRVWRFPLYKLYTKVVTESPLADVCNYSNGMKTGGSCHAAAFLQEFVNSGNKWMHIDIASVMENKSGLPYMSRGMSGRPTRTLIQFLHNLADKKLTL